ncbi:MAG: DUF4177 domain-containing protein [Frankiales bacterium]|nr:DUF4177 domain-containing protein [Frankiales bacterium]
MAQRYEYLVEQIREGLMGGKMSAEKVQKVLNDKARDGWQLKALTAVEVKGRIGPGGTEGMLATFERPVS